MEQKCSFCHRNIKNYNGNFFILTFKKEEGQPQKPEGKYLILEPNKKWLCAIHYQTFYGYSNLSWTQALDIVMNKLQYKPYSNI